MSLIKEYYEAEIQQNAANNPNPVPHGTHVGAVVTTDFTSYLQWIDEEIESVVKATDARRMT